MRSEIEKYIYPNFFSKGYPLITIKLNEIWAKMLNILINCFEKEFGNISVVNTLPLTSNMDLLSRFYGKYFNKLEDQIPVFIDSNNDKKVLLTDKLPLAVNYLKNNKIDNLITTYTVVRPRSFGLQTYLYEEFIRYFQLLISTVKYDEDEYTKKIRNALTDFFKKINLYVVLGGRPSESYYVKKSTFFSVWFDNRITDILQCGLLRESVVESVYISNKSRLIMDIGGSQRLITSWLYANSDSIGLKFPYEMRQYDILFAIKETTVMSKKVVELCENKNFRILIDQSLGKKKFNQIKNLGYNESVDVLILQRKENGKEFYNVFFRDGKTETVDSIAKIEFLLSKLHKMYDNILMNKQGETFKKYVEGINISPSTYFGRLPIVNEGIFIKNNLLTED